MRSQGPVADPIPCSGCGRLLDPLRAGHVAIFDERFHYFCSRSRCRGDFLAPWGGESTVGVRAVASKEQERASRPSRPSASETPTPNEGRARKISRRAADVVRTVTNALAPVVPEDELPELPPLEEERGFVEPIAHPVLTDLGRHEVPEPREFGALLLLIAIIAGALAVLLALAGGDRLILIARAMLAAVGAGMLVARALTTSRDAADPHPIASLAGVVLSTAAAGWAVVRSDAATGSEGASLAGTVVTVSAISAWLLESARSYVHAERSWVQTALAIPGRVEEPEKGTRNEVMVVRPGESVVVEEEEDVPVDLTVTGGDVDVLPWLGAASTSRRRKGDSIVAGAHVVRGRLRGTATWTGLDRAYARVLLDPRRRVDALAPVARSARSLSERWAPIAAIGAAGVIFALHRSWLQAGMVLAAVQAGLGSAIIGGLSAIHVARGVLDALRRGITYKSADAWDRAARVQIAVFSARGTLLLGEPEVAEIEPFAQNLEADELLALAAGGERSEAHPVAHAILRAAKARGIRPDSVRNPNGYPGLGVVAVTSNGEELAVGNRAMMLKHRVAVATAEPRIAELEALGRSVILVALSGRLAGIIALQDGIRPGARAAVQHLLDAQVEPVLMSGDSRDTCEAISRSLDIEHIRPEVLPSERAEEVKRLEEGGSSVAVLGHGGIDDEALRAADVAIGLGSAGSAAGEFEVALASDDVRDAALSIALAKRARSEARLAFALAALPAVIGIAVVSLGVLPAVFVPVASLVGGAMGVLHGKTLDRMRNPVAPALPG